MIAFLRELAAVPFMVLYFAANFLKLPIRVALARGAWVVSGQILWAQTWIWQTAKTRGAGKAEGYAEDVIRKTKDARIPGSL